MSRFAAALIVALALSTASAAGASTVLRLNANGTVSAVSDPYLRPAETVPVPPGGAARSPARARTARTITVSAALAHLRRTGAITAAQQRSDYAVVTGAVATANRLGGTRGAELTGVLDNLRTVAAEGLLSASRLPALLLTVRRNVQWWTRGSLLASGQRVEFSGSDVVWEHYPGQGVELQELGSFGKANGMFDARQFRRMRKLLGELIPLAVDRAGGIAWEYFFAFEAGQPPWTSAMSQATAIEALSRAYRTNHDRAYLRLAQRALPVLVARPPTGVSVPTRRGRRYLLYSFAPGEAVINGFLQTLIGLKEFVNVSHDARARRLFAQGDAEARAELPSYDTGAWSLYEPGQESTLDYHQLVTGFLQTLCGLTRTPLYCAVGRRFNAYLHTAPTITLLTGRVRVGSPATLSFRLSKASHVGVIVSRAGGGARYLYTSASFPYGVGGFALPALPSTGRYSVVLSARDLAGNFHRTTAVLTATR